ncbi:AzlD domain-containing protein [uncultured Cedecea sp.]|uniref:AzlD domain-containing protein n=1 Tax=uncultured Cedecea sp. TaxID=988762 RepID=UPI0026083258|nr:AzlD domain-containing protein [uncultured Cedecea sp.]
MSGTFTILAALALLAAGTYLMRFTGAKLGSRLVLSERAGNMLNDAATTLLFSVALATTFFEAEHFAGMARVAGVAIAVFLAWRKVPLIIVILAAATVTAMLRFLGVP